MHPRDLCLPTCLPTTAFLGSSTRTFLAFQRPQVSACSGALYTPSLCLDAPSVYRYLLNPISPSDLMLISAEKLPVHTGLLLPHCGLTPDWMKVP